MVRFSRRDYTGSRRVDIVDEDMSAIVIELPDGQQLEMSVADADGALVLRSLHGRLSIEPQVSNVVHVRSIK
jgi:hypothetical protein